MTVALEFTDLPPEAQPWENLAAAGRQLDAYFDWAPAHRVVFELFEGRWIAEIHHMGARKGWVRRFIVRAGQPVFRYEAPGPAGDVTSDFSPPAASISAGSARTQTLEGTVDAPVPAGR